VNLGDTYQVDHLWVVVSLPDDDGAVALVNFTGWRSRLDDENCVIQPGEHPFVKKMTIVEYRRARVFSPAHQKAFIDSVLCKPHVPVSARLLDKIQQGALRSDLTSGKVKALITQSLPRQE
jgi:hypothetical protein